MNNKKKEIIKKEIKLPNSIKSKLQQQISPTFQTEENNQQKEVIIANNENKPKINYTYYQKEIYINNKRKNPLNVKRQIYTKVRSDSQKYPFKKVQISHYIYKNGKPESNNNLTTDYVRYNSNTKYTIKNPVKEKSKNKLNKYYSQNILNTNSKNLRLINNIVNNTDIIDRENNYIYNNDEEMQIINNTNYNFRTKNEINLNINNTEYDNDIYKIDTNQNRSKGGYINLNPIKKQHIAFNRRTNAITRNYQETPRESHISYIYDYSQENNKDSYYIESPNNAVKYLSVYPLKPRLKKRENKTDMITFNKKSPKRSHEKLKKQIEESRLKFEKIREIEKKVKKYFSTNGLSLENRELYDQSATMIQSAFRAYYSRMKLFKELNTFVNIGFMIDILKKIFFPRKSDYWENFLKGILTYLSYINNIDINKTYSSNIQYIHNDKSEFTDIKPIKKIPKSHRNKKSGKQFKNNILLMPQLCVSFDLIKNDDSMNKDINKNNINVNRDRKDLEEKIKKLMIENEQLKKSNQNLRAQFENYISNQKQNDYNNDNNIVKDTQKSVELQLSNDFNIPLAYSNKELKKSKLKYLLKNKMFKVKEFLHKYFLRFYYNAMHLKNMEKKPMIYTKNKTKNSFNNNINNSNSEYSFREKKDDKVYQEIIKKLKSLCINLDKKRSNILKNKFIIFYFKGLVHQIQNNKKNNNNDENEKKENNIDDQNKKELNENV